MTGRVSRVAGPMILGAVVAVSVAVASGAFAGGEQSDQPSAVPEKFIEVQDLPVAVEEAVGSFSGSFPRGTGFSYLSNLSDSEEAFSNGPVLFEDTYATSKVLLAWQCAWEAEYVAAFEHGHDTAAAQAADQLSGFYDLPEAKLVYDDPQRQWARAVLEPALNGDIEPMKLDVQTNCRPIG